METWASVRGTLDKFFTYLSNCTVVVVVSVDTDGVTGETGASDVVAVVDVVSTGAVFVPYMYDVAGSLSGHLLCLSGHPFFVGTIV